MKKFVLVIVCIFTLHLTLSLVADDKEDLLNALKKFRESDNATIKIEVRGGGKHRIWEIKVSDSIVMKRKRDILHIKSSVGGAKIEMYKIRGKVISKGRDGTWKKEPVSIWICGFFEIKDMIFDESALEAVKEVKLEGEAIVNSVKCKVYSLIFDGYSLAKFLGKDILGEREDKLPKQERRENELPEEAGDSTKKVKGYTVKFYIGKEDSLPRKMTVNVKFSGCLLQYVTEPDDSDKDYITYKVTMTMTDYNKTEINIPEEVKVLLESDKDE